MAIFLFVAGGLLAAILYAMFSHPRGLSVRERHLEFDKATVASNRGLVATELAWAGIRTKAADWCRRCGGLHLPGEAPETCNAVAAHSSPPRESIEFHCRVPPTDAERKALEDAAIECLRGWAKVAIPSHAFYVTGEPCTQQRAIDALAKLGEKA